MGTNNGLSRYDPQTQVIRNYTVANGLQASEFNSGAQYITSDGTMCLGGVNGLNLFKPENIRSNPFLPPVAFLEFFTTSDSSLFNIQCAEGKISPINLNHNQNSFALKFSALNYINSENNLYRYKMKPIDTNWQNLGSENSVTFANLAPGTYEFEIQGSNNEGLWNAESRILPITINPPFWQTGTFRLVMAIALCGVVFLAFQLRFRRIRQRNLELEHRVQERTDELVQANEELQTALDNVTKLEGMLPICSACKKIRDDGGYWHQVESYIHEHSDVRFSHGLCPECIPKYFPGEMDDSQKG